MRCCERLCESVGVARLLALMSALMLAVVIAGCASTPGVGQQADAAFERGAWDAAIVYYQQALTEDPRDTHAEIMLKNARLKSSAFHLAEARRLWSNGNLSGAALEYEVVLRMDPTNQLAREEHVRLLQETGSGEPSIPPDQYFDTINANVGLPPVPELAPATDEFFSVSVRDTLIKDIYRTLGRIGEINVLFDGAVEDVVTSFEVNDVGFEQALDLLSITHGHYYKVINPTTLLVIPNTPDKRAEYEQLAVRTFYLSNASPAAVAESLTRLLETAIVVQTAELNAVTVRDTPERLMSAAEIVRRLDKSRGEVMLEIEILEADRSVMREFGISLSEYGITQTLAQGDGAEGGNAGISLNDLRSINATDWFFQIPSIRYQFMRQDGNFKIIAQPRLRISEGNTSSLVIGEEVPIVTTTFSTTATVGGNVVPFSTTTYRDVGIVMSVTPRIHHNREITIDLELEISAVSRTARVTPTLELPVFTTRKVSTVLRLREGETNVLAGLLRDDERTSMQGIIGLSSIPLLGRLFGVTTEEVQQTDVIMSITPHIIQVPNITAADLEVMTLGGDTRLMALSGAAPGAEAGPGLIAEGQGAQEQPPAPTIPGQALISPAQSVVAVGDEFSIDVRIEDALDVSRVTLNLTYDPSYLQFIDSTAGGFMTSDDAQGSVEVSPAGPNRLTIVGLRGPQAGGIGGAGRLVTLRFRAIAAGESLLDMQGSAFQGPDGTVLEAQFWGARVTARQDR